MWIAATFRWHPTSEAPPIMGLIFADAEAARELFRVWTDAKGHGDELDELRVAIVEGDVPGQAPGYSVHLCPDPEAIAISAMAFGKSLPDKLEYTGQIRRMHPQHGNDPTMMPTFKREYQKHGKYLLCPVTQRDDDQFWFDVESGIEKTTLHLRRAEDITNPSDIDYPVVQPPPAPPEPPIFEAT
jgi:hypothetical protein